MPGLSQRILPALQLTRMALVFTAIADSTCAMLLWARWNAPPGRPVTDYLEPKRFAAILIISIGLYGFGMSLNDIIDRRRDEQISPGRPLPSGRISVITAHLICAILAIAAILGGIAYATVTPAHVGGWMSLMLVVWTGLLISFYDYAAKYLVAPGLLSLGLIRFFHAAIPAPTLPLLWHPLLLLNHVTILSTVGYALEQKRPPLTKIHWWAVLSGLAIVDVLAIGTIAVRRNVDDVGLAQSLWITPGLLLPLAAVAVFVLLAVAVKMRTPNPRDAGQKIILYGLLWLIVYDAAFIAGYVSWKAAAVVLALLPVAWMAVQLMRWWSRILSLSEKPQFQRARE